MKVFVISIEDSQERRANVNKQLQSAGVKYRFFDAVNGNDGYEKYFDAYDERECLINTGRVATPGEVGCYASHLFLWKKCVSLNEPIMIMEDDFIIDNKFTAAVVEVERLIKQYGFIRLQTETKGKKRKVKESGNFILYYYTKMPHSTICYAINPSIAKIFIRKSSILNAPVDVFIKKNWEHRQTLFGLYPYTAKEGLYSDVPTIKGRVKAKKSIKIKMIRFFAKVKWLVLRLRFNMLYGRVTQI